MMNAQQRLQLQQQIGAIRDKLRVDPRYQPSAEERRLMILAGREVGLAGVAEAALERHALLK